MITQAEKPGVRPVIGSPTVKKSWQGGRTVHGPNHYAEWLEALAPEADIPFVELSRTAADALEAIGKEAVRA